MTLRKKLTVLGFLNAVYMYFTYPLCKVLEVYADFFDGISGAICTIAFILTYGVHIFVNIKAITSFDLSDVNDSFDDLKSLIKGIVIGSISTMVVLLIISIFNTPFKYFYTGIDIPFKLLTSVLHAEYFLVSIVYIVFVYELSKRLYTKKQN